MDNDANHSNSHMLDPRTPLLSSGPNKSRNSLSRELTGLFQDWWLWEVFGAITSVLALLVIVTILMIYNSSSLPDWPSIFTV